MIDIHCHILPNIDDGSKSLEESIKMARIAEREGIKKIVNTSHYNPIFEYEKGEHLLSSLKDFNEILKKESIKLEVLPGNELYYTSDLLENIEKLDFYTINDSKYLLIEFPTTNFPRNLCDIVYEIKLKGYIPILAHVERYDKIQEDPNLIFECIKEGALIQVNASSIITKNRKEIKKTTDILLDCDMVHLIGTDAHSAGGRSPLIKDAYEYVCSKYGKERGDNLFLNNADLVICNKDIIISKPQKYIEKKGFLSKLFRK